MGEARFCRPELQFIGDEWVNPGASAVLEVPSAVIETDSNYLLNPAWVCSQCGEPLFEAHEVQVIQDALKALDRESGRLLAAGV